MRRLVVALAVASIVLFQSPAGAETLIPPRRSVVTLDADFPGGDIRSIFDTTFNACERACLANSACTAFTFNSRNGSCFLKNAPGAPQDYQGAQSAVIVSADPAVIAAAGERRRELAFIFDWDFEAALEQARTMGNRHTTGPWSVAEHMAAAAENEARGDWVMAMSFTGAALNRADSADLWLEYARRAAMAADVSEGGSWEYRLRAYYATINAYLRSESRAQRATVLVEMARALEVLDRGRDMVAALRLAQAIAPRDDTAALLADAVAKYGFRIEETTVEADLARPRVCATFTEDLVASGVEYGDYVRLPDPSLSVELAGDRQLCVAGVRHGERYRITFREGLPAADGQQLAATVDQELYVRDRNPGVRFPGRGYVLPRTDDAALPVETVNTGAIELTLYRVTDRNILRAIQEQYFGAPMMAYQEEAFSDQIGERVWSGTASVAQELNRDVTTRLPMGEALSDQPAGIYALRASVPGADPYDQPAAWQWFVVSDLGLTTLAGVDGLHVIVRSLATAEAKPGVGVELLSRANTLLASATTDADGIARFEAGLTRGRGAAEPGMIVVREGDADIAFLSLSDPEFDLSDRGVEGRAAAQAVDVFLTTDRGAYRAGEVVNITALARDTNARAIEGLPLTVLLRRPDGVEYSRNVMPDAGAGGHVLSLPIAATAPRGMWSFAILADADAAPLAQTTFLVEDFLPERIDFTLSAPEGPVALAGGELPVTVEARYLFGAPGAGLAIEGEVTLAAGDGLAKYPGFVFGRYDRPFSPLYRSLGESETAEDGAALVEAPLPEADDPGQPLAATVTLRVSEGSGRPVERRITRDVLPPAPMIGVKPLFDGVVPEGGEARFEVIGIGPDLAPHPMAVKWELARIETEYQWYQKDGNWDWEPVVFRSTVAEGEAETGPEPVEIAARVDWGQYELRVIRADGAGRAETATGFWAGWFAPADVSATPDTLEMSLDRAAYAVGDMAQLRVVARSDGVALVSVLTNRVVATQSVAVHEGENLIPLVVTDDWGSGAYVTVSLVRPMDTAAGRNPARALGIAHAAIDPGPSRLTTAIEAPAEAAPRAPLDVAVRVQGVAPGESAYVTVAAVDQGILNLTGFQTPDPAGYYFGQRKLGVAIRDLYGRLIDGLNGAMGSVRSGGDGGAQARLQAPPPTEELVAQFSGVVQVGADGYARLSFAMPSFNGTVKVMAVAWTKTAVGQASADVLVRDPVVVSASLPRFMAPGDASRLRLEFTHVSGPDGVMDLAVSADGLELGSVPPSLLLVGSARQVVEVPVVAGTTGTHALSVTLTTPDGRVLVKPLVLPVSVNDPEITRVSRLDLKKGQSLTLDQELFDGLLAGTGHSAMAIGPLARLNTAGLLASLERYPYGCTEQVTSKAIPLLYLSEVARVMERPGTAGIDERISQAITAVLSNQGSEGGFGLWGPGDDDFWLDAYVTDFLSRARAQGHPVPELAFRNALANLRNQVNIAPDFDASSNEGGVDLAYALMVLAREGAAAIGDLRYYADVKGDDFATPLAMAQLGAALASYGDQTRADAMFRRAAAALEAAQDDRAARIWRTDYGTSFRDAAAILALATEAGSMAIDRVALSDRVGQQAAHLSPQEAAWALMAASALIDRPESSGIIIGGEPATGPLVRTISDGDAPLTVTNTGPDTVLTLTTWGVPRTPEPAGGNGYAISRSYFTLDGAPVSVDSVTAGDRLVTVIEVTPFEDGESRLIVNDPLPAGFEIDNPNLISGGNVSQLDWLEAETDVAHAEFRQDRFIAAYDHRDSSTFRLAYIVRAVTPGSFRHPAPSVEDMYRPEFRAWGEAGRVDIAAR